MAGLTDVLRICCLRFAIATGFWGCSAASVSAALRRRGGALGLLGLGGARAHANGSAMAVQARRGAPAYSCTARPTACRPRPGPAPAATANSGRSEL
jgi:hypothetical protein